MKSVIVALFCAALSGITGYARFGALAANPPVWLDVLFLFSSAALLALAVTYFIGRLKHIGGEAVIEHDPDRTDGAEPRDLRRD